jgi:hypothetical protein
MENLCPNFFSHSMPERCGKVGSCLALQLARQEFKYRLETDHPGLQWFSWSFQERTKLYHDSLFPHFSNSFFTDI